jgi:hypothetical protein
MLIVEDSYSLETSLVTEHMPPLVDFSAACSTHASTSCTLPAPSAIAPASRSQYIAPCDDDDYYLPSTRRKILFEFALLDHTIEHHVP